MVDRSSPWDVIYFKAATGAIPAVDFLKSCPAKIRAGFVAILDAVAEAPPPQFSGGGKWEAMHGMMTGWFEIRLTGPGREQFRLFCLLENGTDEELVKRGLHKPCIAVIQGLRKPWRTIFSDRDYAKIRKLGKEHQGNCPRLIG